jgi:hypothetical protein
MVCSKEMKRNLQKKLKDRIESILWELL